jgi:hypothetical protein
VVGAESIGTGTTEFIPLYVTMIKQQLQSIEPALQPGDQVHKTVSYAYSLTKAGDSAQNPVSECYGGCYNNLLVVVCSRLASSLRF